MTSPVSLSAGDQRGPYRIVALIGSGGMGEVYKAWDTRLNRTVALKVSKDEFSERLTREAHAIAALNHPHICQIYDVGPDYIVMEFVDGQPIKGPLPLPDALRVATQIADALTAAHLKGITHRDLKPANILLTTSGVKLLDFGLAKVTAPENSDATQTIAGTVMGTAAYMSPEQAQGKPADARSDIFSFGLVFYELLSGRRAFTGESAVATMAAILHKEPAPLDAPSTVQNVIARCIRKSPTDRFQSALELRSALEAAAAKSGDKTPSIAVLPFANMDADPDQEYFSDGLAEEIINALTQVSGLKVIARTSAFAFKGKNEDVRKIAETLGVTNVLEGSVRRAGGRIRVTAQLIQAIDGTHLWSQRYDRELADVFAIQDEISAAIATQLQIRLLDRKRATPNVAAYDAFLEGRHYFYQQSPAGLERALRCYERAIAIDPGYAPAHNGIAEYYMGLTWTGISDPRQTIPRIEVNARRALELDPGLADAYAMLGHVAAFTYDWAAAERYFLRGIELDPHAAHARTGYLAWFLRPHGRFQEVLQQCEQILALDPLSHLIRFQKAVTLYFLRRYEEAADWCERTEHVLPNFLASNFVYALIGAERHRFQEAIEIMQKMIETHGRGSFPLGNLGTVYAMAGRSEEAQRILAELDELSRKTFVLAWGRVMIHAQLGEIDTAFEWAEKAIEQREPLILFLNVYPTFDPLRSDPRYPALLKKMNLA